MIFELKNCALSSLLSSSLLSSTSEIQMVRHRVLSFFLLSGRPSLLHGCALLFSLSLILLTQTAVSSFDAVHLHLHHVSASAVAFRWAVMSFFLHLLMTAFKLRNKTFRAASLRASHSHRRNKTFRAIVSSFSRVRAHRSSRHPDQHSYDWTHHRCRRGLILHQAGLRKSLALQ